MNHPSSSKQVLSDESPFTNQAGALGSDTDEKVASLDTIREGLWKAVVLKLNEEVSSYLCFLISSSKRHTSHKKQL